MAKVTPITEHFQHFVSELKEIQQASNMIEELVLIDIVEPAIGEQPLAHGHELRKPGMVGKKGHLFANLQFRRLAGTARRGPP